jgi:GDP-4-dehydro-6-deoxy-D-mannose reductase
VPNSVYGRTKLAAEQMLADVLPAELRLIVVRPSNHVGPGQDERFALPSFARQLAEGERAGGPIAISVGNLEAERDFMDVRDVVRAYLALLANAESRGVYNIASGSVRPVRELLDMMRSAARVETRVEVDPDRQRAVDIPVAAVNADRIRAETGWKPCFAMERTLADLLADVRARQAPQPIG